MKLQPDQLAKELRARLSYDPATGVFTRLVAGGNGAKAGDQAGYINAGGYVVLSVCNERLYAHRAAWFMTYGKWPDQMIDHIDGDRTNNRLSNLRDVSNQHNTQNVKKSRREGGLLGTCWDKRRCKWVAHIMKDGRGTFLGYHPTPEQAHSAYMSAKAVMHEGFVA